MVTDELFEYVKKLVDSGMSTIEIANILHRDGGWGDMDIEAVISSVQTLDELPVPLPSDKKHREFSERAVQQNQDFEPVLSHEESNRLFFSAIFLGVIVVSFFVWYYVCRIDVVIQDNSHLETNSDYIYSESNINLGEDVGIVPEYLDFEAAEEAGDELYVLPQEIYIPVISQIMPKDSDYIRDIYKHSDEVEDCLFFCTPFLAIEALSEIEDIFLRLVNESMLYFIDIIEIQEEFCYTSVDYDDISLLKGVDSKLQRVQSLLGSKEVESDLRLVEFRDVIVAIIQTGYVVNEDFYTAVQNDDYSSCDLIIKNVDDNEDRIDSLLRNLYIQEIMILE